ncbi:MAG TPA: rhamnan synthesis F family protein [Xanthomonadaceae bacterium]|jgi:glycosyltransferase involved in cell wall biosynthesis
MADRPCCILVLGMHRSGTSALTRVLNLLGCALPGDLLGANPSNPAGHWESRRALEINDALLHGLGREWDDLRAMPADWLCSDAATVARGRIVEFVRAEAASAPLWALKDPRLCLLAPLWIEVLDELGVDVRVVVPIRDPVEVAASLSRRDGTPPAASHLLWLRHVVAAEAASRNRRRVLAGYDGLLADPHGLADRIAHALGIAWPSATDAARAAIGEFLNPELRHAAPDAAEATHLPALLERLRPVWSGADDASAWNAIAGAAAELADGAGLFEPAIADLSWCYAHAERSVATLEAAQRHVELLKARVAEMDAALKQREAIVHELEQAVADRDTLISGHLEAHEDDRARLTALGRKLVEFDRLVGAKEGEIDVLRRTAAELEHACRMMTDSRSWRVTRPLRAITTALRERSLRAAIAKSVRIPESPPGFDAQYYLMEYPDVRASGLDPYRHYLEHGKAEGRMPMRPPPMAHTASAAFDPAKENVLVVTHDASRTGAPVLSLNIVVGLRDRYNVVLLPYRVGSLMDAFRRHATLAVEPDLFRNYANQEAGVVEALHEKHPFKFAIVNSIESRGLLPTLAALEIPTVSLIHEFAAYTRPRNGFPEAVWWATRTVFSAALTRDSAMAEFPEFADADFAIVPQGRCTLTTEAADPAEQAVEDTYLLNRLRPDGLRDDTVLVIGAGSVQHRKGVDLFIQCAARVQQAAGATRYRFAWIGHGYDPQTDMAYSAYLADQIQRSGLEGSLAMIGETSRIETAYKVADMLLVTSRLDPLPNVAIDAMAHGLPVLCFERTTGIADVLADAGLGDLCVSPYLDVADMAAKVAALAVSKPLRAQIGKRLRPLVAEQFAMPAYVERLEAMALDACRQVEAEVEATKTILASSLARTDFLCRVIRKGAPLEDIVRFEYVRAWATGVGRRKVFPGFHPGIYAEQHGLAGPWADPLADYLRAGRPDGPWCRQVIAPDGAVGRIPEGVRVALHVHAYYLDLLPEVLKRLEANSVRPDLFVSVADEEGVARARKLLARYDGNVVDVVAVRNRGRDIGPLLTAFGPQLTGGYEFVGHVHTKKTADLQDPEVGRRWFEFLLENLLGGKAHMADIVLGHMAADASIGMVFPDDPNIVGWGSNMTLAREFGERLGLRDLPKNISFPVGTMFWARVDAIRPMFDLGLQWNDYPAEPIPYDGSILHAIERLFPFVVEAQGHRCAVTNVPGVSR